jgi:hypothetical protein
MPDLNREALRQKTMDWAARLGWAAEKSQLGNVRCPACHRLSVSVWFTHPAEDAYRTWFICTQCSFHSRALNLNMPPFFSEDRRRADLEEQDRSILERAVFKKPLY